MRISHASSARNSKTYGTGLGSVTPTENFLWAFKVFEKSIFFKMVPLTRKRCPAPRGRGDEYCRGSNSASINVLWNILSHQGICQKSIWTRVGSGLFADFWCFFRLRWPLPPKRLTFAAAMGVSIDADGRRLPDREEIFQKY